MNDQPVLEERRLGARYRIDEPDGTWWALGWDRPLGTFYAQHWSPEPFDPFTPDEPLAWFGTRPSEIPSPESLADVISVPIPAIVVGELHRDRAAFPHLTDPPFLRFAAAFLEADEHEIPVTLPAEPVAEAITRLRRDPYLAARDLTEFADGLGVDTDLARGIVDGTITALQVDEIAHICEALHCSPLDLWIPEVSREILDVYGPDRWPRHIEPLTDGRSLTGESTLLERHLPLRVDEVLARGVQPSTELEVTRFRQVAVLGVDAHGDVETVPDASRPADPSREYHFAFQQIGAPRTEVIRVTAGEFRAGPPAGHDAHPALVDAADKLERGRPGADLIRFRDLDSDSAQWVGRETPFDPWQTWDDPRQYYPGDPNDVLREGVEGVGHPELPIVADEPIIPKTLDLDL